jgi:prefoldin beta subunit
MSEKISKETEQMLQQLQLIEQNVQNFTMQRQQFQGQLIEIDSALEELNGTPQAYKIVGNIMVAAAKDSLSEDLKSRKEAVELRIKALEKQEQQLKQKAEKMQAEVMEALKK